MDFLIPLLLMALPVLLVVFLTQRSGKALRGSCGGVGADGSCTRCGRQADEIPERGSEHCP